MRRGVWCAPSCAVLSAAPPLASAAAPPAPAEAAPGEVGGRCEAVLAGTLAGHRTADGADAFQASADVTEPVRRAEPGPWTVGPRSGEPRLALDGKRYPKDTGGRLGVIAHDGDRGTAGDYLDVRTGRQEFASISDSAHSANALPNSGVTEFGKAGTARFPAAGNTLGCVSDVFDLRGAPRNGADRVHVRLGSRGDTVWPGALFPQADVRR
ncbi:hypothetical protein ABZ618_12945 [Streptomyces roseolus]|uniref:hypothetical protein n=1 Tax=Streptomyces roseolus TaxID=67358 RepID=UPI0033DBB3F8